MGKHILGDEIGPNCYSSIEIDESSIIGNPNIIIWMFGMEERISKNDRINCVFNDRTQDNLLNIFSKNVATNINDEDDKIEENEDDSI